MSDKPTVVEAAIETECRSCGAMPGYGCMMWIEPPRGYDCFGRERRKDRLCPERLWDALGLDEDDVITIGGETP